ncbi:hypothetical protein MVES1_002750 [Malassezia vespertilionis]|nr:uncharacterized protein MVES1_002750 [Malassezia vespertilionis]WFD07386.1 hypothetical protein MVES1_002750 [Malassezia vespertilionis]
MEQLQDQIRHLHALSVAHGRDQQAALHALDVEQNAVDEALARIEMDALPVPAQGEGMLLRSEAHVRYSLSNVCASLSTIPLLAVHAMERRRTRALLSAPHWSAQDVENLRIAVECERTRAETLRQSPALDWDAVSTHVPHHTASDCRTRWTFHEQPSLNHARWSGTEKKALLAHAAPEDPGFSWVGAASVLHTGRTGYSALETYQRNTKPTVAWSPSLDDALLATAKQVGPDWRNVARSMGFPVSYASVCHQRHSKLKASGLVLGRWGSTEDAALRAAVAAHGTDWKRVEIEVPGRSGQQCRERWVGRLANIPEGETQATRRAWLPEEDARLRACVHRCKTWVEVARYVGKRSDKMVRYKATDIRYASDGCY